MQQYEKSRTYASNRPTESQIQRWQTQEDTVFHSFHERPKTMYQVEVETGIMRPSVCRFVARLKKEGKIKIIKIDVDDLTGCRAQYLSTNYRYWPQQSQAGKQIDMFD